jgi:ribose transport system substrate-binding protein
VFSTIVQQPYEFGFQSVKLMAKVLEGDKTIIPTEKKIIVPTKVINKESVEEFSKKLKELLGK